MTPEERTLLSDLFRRLREVETHPRDGEAEDFIRRSVQDQPLSAYYMAQTVLVQQQALTAAQTRIEELERQARERTDRPASGGGSFLSNALGIGRSPWSRGGDQPPAAAPPPSVGRSPWGAPPNVPLPNAPPPNVPPNTGMPGYGQPGAAYPQQPYPQYYPQAGMAPRGGGFFAGAAQTAAGVAGGMLAASAISSLLHHSPGPFGEAMAQTPGAETTVNETVINNYYGDDQGTPADDAAQDVSYDQDQPTPDDTPFDDGGSGGDDSWI